MEKETQKKSIIEREEGQFSYLEIFSNPRDKIELRWIV